jgi:urate oxidase
MRMVTLGENRYGKAEVHVVRIGRGEAFDGSDLIRDWTVSSSLSGDVDECYLSGDNANVLTTDTQKNTAFAVAQRLGDVEPEVLALELATHFVTTQAPITRARIEVRQDDWGRLGPHSFARSGRHTRSAVIVHDAELGSSAVGGVTDLVLLNTTDSEFWGFPRDKFTTLAETNDRVLATEVQAQWRFRGVDVDWSGAFALALEKLMNAFRDTYSYSLQQTLYAMGTAVIDAVPDICEVRLALPNKHHFLVDLAPFDQPNANEVFYAADRPYGLIEGQVLADDAPDAGLAWA